MKRILCILLCWAMTSGVVSAATLAEMVKLAWERHPEARELEARRVEAEAARAIAGGWFPAPGAIGLGGLDDRSGQDVGKREIEAEVAVPVWLPGQRGAYRAHAEYVRDSVDASAALLRLRLAGDVRETWGALQFARTNLELARQRFETSETLQVNVERRLRAGDLATVDANLARQERLSAEATLAEAQLALTAAEQSWRLLTGSVPPIELLDAANDDTQPSLDTHPSVRAAQAAADAARARLRVAEESGREHPEVALNVIREREEFGAAQNTLVGLKFRLPFASAARRRQASAGAQAELANADAALALAREKAGFERTRAAAEVEAAKRQLQFAEERRALSEENLRLAQKAFDLGELDLPRLLEARARALEAELSLNQQTHALALALGRERQAQGVIP